MELVKLDNVIVPLRCADIVVVGQMLGASRTPIFRTKLGVNLGEGLVSSGRNLFLQEHLEESGFFPKKGEDTEKHHDKALEKNKII